MRYILLFFAVPFAALVLHGRAGAQNAPSPVPVEIQRLYLGSGEPARPGYENATFVLDGVYHAPQYLPGRPTAASIWPRVIDVPCTALATGGLRCQGYSWTPAMGRAEYLYFRPVMSGPRPVGAGPAEVVLADSDAAPPAPPVEGAADNTTASPADPGSSR